MFHASIQKRKNQLIEAGAFAPKRERMSPEDVEKAKIMIREGSGGVEIARLLGVSDTAVYQLKNRMKKAGEL